MDVKIKLEGFAELDKELRELPLRLQGNILRSALMKGAKIVQDELKRTAPVSQDDRVRMVKKKSGEKVEHRPGFLRSRVRRRSAIRRKEEQRGMSGDTAALVRVGVTGVPYAGSVEYGTADAPANPFVRRAWEATKDQMLDLIKGQLRKRLDKAKSEK